MADTKISALTSVATVDGADEFAVNDAGTSKKANAGQISTYINTNITLGGSLDVNGQEIISSGATDILLHSDNDVNIVLGDALGVDDFNIKDSGDATVFSVNSDGAVTATSYGGILEANLLDKSTTETVSGKWTFSGDIYSSGQISVGTEDETSITIGGSSFDAFISAHVETATDFDYLAHRHSDTVSAAGTYLMARSRGIGTAETAIVSGDRLGEIAAVGHDGTDYAFGARIQFQSTGTVGANTIPTNIIFRVAPDGGGGPETAMTINEDTSVTFASGISVAGGMVQDFTAGSTIAQGDIVYIASDAKVDPADADAASTAEPLGIAQAAAVLDGTVSVLLGGVSTIHSGLTAGSIYYLSVTAGAISTSAPSGSGDVIVKIGTAISTTALRYEPQTMAVLA